MSIIKNMELKHGIMKLVNYHLKHHLIMTKDMALGKSIIKMVN